MGIITQTRPRAAAESGIYFRAELKSALFFPKVDAHVHFVLMGVRGRRKRDDILWHTRRTLGVP